MSRLALTAAISILVLIGLLALRLLQGPLSLGVLTPFIEQAMDDALENYQAKIGDTVLRWSREEGRVDLSFVGVTLRDKAQRAVLAIPQMEIGFSAKALAHGILAPSEVQFIGPSATIMRTADGRIQLGFKAPGTDTPNIEADALVRKIVESLREAPGGSRLGYLERFYVREAALTLYDSITKSIWRAPDSLVAMTRAGDDLVLRLDTKVEAGAGSFDLAAEGRLRAGQEAAQTTLHLNGLRLSKLAEGTNGLEPFAGVDVPVHGDATVRIGLDGTIEQATFWLFANAGRVVMPGLPSVALDLNAAEVKGAFDARTDKIRLERLVYDAGTNHGFIVGTADLRRSPQGVVDALGFDLESDGIALDMPTLFNERGVLDHVAVRGALDFGRNQLSLDEVSLAMGKAKMVIAGTVEDGPDGVGININGSLEHLPVADFAKLWPIGPARGARDWITENIHAGEIKRGALRITAAPGELADAKIPDSVVDLTFEFDGLDVTYIRGLTPLAHAEGHARLTGQRFELEMARGQIGALEATNGHFSCEDLETHGAPGAIDVHLSGDTKELLRVLDMAPLEYPTKFGIDPTTVGGTMAGDLSIVVPLRRAVHFADVDLKAQATTAAFSLPAVYRDFEISDGVLTFTITNDALEAKGNASLGGYAAKVKWHEQFADREKVRDPTVISVWTTLDAKGRARAVRPLDDYLKGRTPLSLTVRGSGQDIRQLELDTDLTAARVMIPEFDWTKASGTPGRIALTVNFPGGGAHSFENINVSGPSLSIKGRADIAPDGIVKRLTLNPFKIGEHTDARLDLTRQLAADGGSTFSLDLDGRAFAAGGLLKDYKSELDKARATDADAKTAARDTQKFSARLDALTLANDVTVRHFSGVYERRTGALRTLSANGTFENGAMLKMSIRPGKGGTRNLLVESADAGALLLGLDLTQNIQSGTVALDVVLPPLGADGRPVESQRATGTLKMSDVRVVKAPILTKVLSVGSLGGIRDMLNGEGLLFETVDLPFKVEGKTILVDSGRAYGPSVGFTIEGRVPRDEGNYDMSGTLVPAYTLNTLLGYVPIIGKILMSREGEGLVGLTYHVRGEASDPHVVVNPLSALTPSFLRRIFQFGDKPKDIPDGG